MAKPKRSPHQTRPQVITHEVFFDGLKKLFEANNNELMIFGRIKIK